MSNKVYKGEQLIAEHVKTLTNLYGMPEQAAHKVVNVGTPEHIDHNKQSLQVRKLKLETGLET